jgi:hypothetical protein
MLLSAGVTHNAADQSLEVSLMHLGSRVDPESPCRV